MKKYITLAALLAAGTTFANAEEDALTITFAEKTVSSISGVLSDTSFGAVSVSLERNSTTGDLYMTTADTSVAAKVDAFTPNQKINNGNWVATFDFTVMDGVELTFNNIDLGVIAFNANGNNQESTDGVTRQVNFEVSVILDGRVVSEGRISNENITGGTYASPMSLDISLNESFTATSDFLIKLTASSGTTNGGTYVGLKNISLSNVPEPSAFGMLAGLGALALVASRRRRK